MSEAGREAGREAIEIRMQDAIAESVKNPEPDSFFKERSHQLLAKRAASYVRHIGPVGRGIDHVLWVWQDGVWVEGGREIRQRIVDLLQDRYNTGHQRNVESFLMGMRECPVIESQPVSEFINFKDGLLDWKTGEMYGHSEAVLSTVQIPHRWNRHAECPRFLTFLGQVVPEDAIPFMQELTGYLMYSGNPFEKAFLFFGGGRNGKGTYLTVMDEMLGRSNVSHVPLQEMGSNRFATADLFGKLANVAGDLDSTILMSTGTFKMVVGNDTIRAEHKGRDAFRFKPFATHVFSANVIPMSVDTTVGYLDRWIVVRFPNTFADDPDSTLKDALCTEEELEGVALWGITGLVRLMRRGHFELPPSLIAAKDEFDRSVDPIRSFIYENAREGDKAKMSEVWPVYAAWCTATHRKALGKQRFNERLSGLPGIRRVQVNGTEYYKGMSLTKSEGDYATTALWY